MCKTPLVALLVLAAGLSACAHMPVGAQGRWVGQLTPTAGTCEAASQALLLVRARGGQADEAVFTPNQGTLALHGTADATGHVSADHEGIGMNHQPYVQAFEGSLQADRIVGTYLTPRCRARVVLQRQ